jgi:DNA-directed RNA polymerase subunit K/omega
MSDNEDEDYEELSGSEENDLDEIDQNDDIDAIQEEGVDIGEDEEPEENIYGPLRTLKIRDGDHKTIIVISPGDRRTSNIINDYEFTEAVGIRASQIERGSPVFTNVTGLKDPIKMARKEFFDRKNPLILERIIDQRGNIYKVEHWKVREMTHPIKHRN